MLGLESVNAGGGRETLRTESIERVISGKSNLLPRAIERIDSAGWVVKQSAKRRLRNLGWGNALYMTPTCNLRLRLRVATWGWYGRSVHEAGRMGVGRGGIWHTGCLFAPYAVRSKQGISATCQAISMGLDVCRPSLTALTLCRSIGRATADSMARGGAWVVPGALYYGRAHKFR